MTFGKPMIATTCAVGLHQRRRRRAFTLPEVLATLVLVSVVLPAILKGVSLAMAAASDAKHKVEATGLAESKLAELKADAMQLISSGGGSGTFQDHPDYQWQAESVAQDTDLTNLTVHVIWTARGQQRSIEMSTFVFTGTTGSSSSAVPGGGS